MAITGRQKPVVNGRKPKHSFITLEDPDGRFKQGDTKVQGKVTDDDGREFTGTVHVRTASELRLRLKCDKERSEEDKKKRGDPDPGKLTITLTNPNVVDIKVPVDYVEDDET
jgi:hypothetical protein